jgi:hypothetical protein
VNLPVFFLAMVLFVGGTIWASMEEGLALPWQAFVFLVGLATVFGLVGALDRGKDR